ncbi:MAG TPA: D-glycerate dehydrogenase [Rhabdochlamydiaceae bacterium]|nr:D-glycerate dehydrogenase [Rhabdochlamydiaceae bacterium]
MKRVLITKQIQPVAKELLLNHFSVDENTTDDFLSVDALRQAVQQYDGILSLIPDQFDADVLSNATRLKVIANLAIGLDNIDVDYAKKKGIAVYNLPDVVTDSTADLTFALFLALIRKIPQAQKFVLENLWKGWEPNLFLGEELKGKIFGIAGFGKIGQAVARRALGFDLKVIVYNRSPIKGEPSLTSSVKQVEWDEFLRESDYISLHVPLTKETDGLIDLEAIKRMSKKPVLINMARGAVIDTQSLVFALQEGLVRGAALDVTSPEPIPATHPLCMMEHCLILPHIGSATIECRTKMAQKAAENLINHLT